MARRDVIVVGGGIIGCTVAWRLAQRGAKVTLVEREQPGAQASSAAAGLLQPEAGRYGGGPLLAHWLDGLRRYPELVGDLREETGMPLEFRITGRLYVALGEAEVPALEERYELQQEAGIACEWWPGEKARQAEPALAEATSAAIYYPEHGLVDNRALVQCAAMAAARRGVEIATGRPVTGLLVDGDRARGVDVGGERLEADSVVIAAGSWSGLLDPRLTVPVRPAKGEILALEARPPVCTMILSSADGSVSSRASGRTVVGATVADEGYDKRVTAWGVQSMLHAAVRLCPSLAHAPILETWAGLRPVVPADHLPIVGETALRGAYVATGHYTMGILSAPVTADAIAGLILDGRSPVAIDAFSPKRFAS